MVSPIHRSELIHGTPNSFYLSDRAATSSGNESWQVHLCDELAVGSLAESPGGVLIVKTRQELVGDECKPFDARQRAADRTGALGL